jgi:hypothetical protein
MFEGVSDVGGALTSMGGVGGGVDGSKTNVDPRGRLLEELDPKTGETIHYNSDGTENYRSKN